MKPTEISADFLNRTSLEEIPEEAIKDPKIQELFGKVKFIVDLQIKHKVPITVKIWTKECQVYSETVHTYKGMPEDLLTLEECRDKFRKCTRSPPGR